GAFRCAYSAAKHLIEGGSTRIVFVKTRSAKQHEEAFSGYAHALKEYQQASLGRPIQINVDENGHRGFYLNSAVDGFPDGIVFLNGLVSAFRLHGVGHRNGSEAVVQAISLSNEAGADVYNLTCHIPQLVGLGEFANSLLIEFINYNHNA
ncbi:MAG TPA: hypothetical protein VD884_20805, partial [Ohtaekwangia sp.]|nr:hypothetical protein [Ohtaekwangia sp.]